MCGVKHYGTIFIFVLDGVFECSFTSYNKTSKMDRVAFVQPMKR